MEARLTMPSRTLIGPDPMPYRNSASTDVRLTFQRVLAEMAQAQAKPKRKRRKEKP